MTTKGRPKVPGESVYVRLDPQIADQLTTYLLDQQKDSPAKISKNSIINYALKKFLEGVRSDENI